MRLGAVAIGLVLTVVWLKDDGNVVGAGPRSTPTPTATTPTGSATSRPYWVQVGAFKDPETAKRVAAKLRKENFTVKESVTRVGDATPNAPATAAAHGSDRYEVVVTGMSVEDVNRRLAGKGLAAEAGDGGVIVKPPLPLREAVALSKDLAAGASKVNLRRVRGKAPAAATSPTVSAPLAQPVEGGTELYRVRVGAFADRAAAKAAVRKLEAKGYKPYITRDDQ